MRFWNGFGNDKDEEIVENGEANRVAQMVGPFAHTSCDLGSNHKFLIGRLYINSNINSQ